MRLLLVEDDLLLGEGVQDGLVDAGFAVDWLQDGEAARTALSASNDFDLIVLDIALPRLNGLQLLAWLRGLQRDIPVLLLTARDGIDDRIVGLNAGADDYLVKPFALGELVARIHALLRRAQGRSGNDLVWRDLRLDPAKQIATLKGEPLVLTAMEFRLLHVLLANSPNYLSRTQLDDKMYGWGGEVESNTLDVHLSHLRKKLGSDAIQNMRGLGWRMGDATP
ncbi:response regulator transcription factor [Chitinibacter bivalviorum]|uniref:Response regulator transcription factor n=1 Tax=Chitinibacter bivalviorum TaxID=2739434 RepID=A0A7H9BKY6_9NEIS|nr:response regulator transcription factor [Chitinibacter bivalviorum]QLG89052.1 response regulator transcription factor [Chitinibacter bivalviorum]